MAGVVHPHSGWTMKSAPGCSWRALAIAIGFHGSMDMALAPPNMDVLPSGYLADVIAQEHVRQKEYLLVLGD